MNGLLILSAMLLAGAAPASRARASDAHMAAMDRFFQCAFHQMREARARGEAPDAYARALNRACGPARETLIDRSAALARAQGLSPRAAADKARRTVAEADAQLLAIYAGN